MCMKKNYAILLVLCLFGTSLMAQTVSSSTLEFKYCMASYGSVTKHVNANNIIYPYEWEGLTWTSGGSQVVTKVNARGCDSIITYTLDVYTPCSKPFTVSTGGQKIYFSPGNLQYQAKGADNQSHWRFAENQWNRIGNAKGNTTASADREKQSDWIDLFGYGTSGKNYYPWRVSNNYSFYPKTDIAGTDDDWGVYNNAALGNPNPTWRTPTQAEWDYLINTRATMRGKARVNNVQGLILLPDGFVYPDHCAVLNTTVSNYTTNVYSSTDEYETWTLMEAAGAVFLPVTGCYSNTTPTIDAFTAELNIYGYYWATGIFQGGYSYNPTYSGYYMMFRHNELKASSSSEKSATYYGYAVRLIRNQ